MRYARISIGAVLSLGLLVSSAQATYVEVQTSNTDYGYSTSKEPASKYGPAEYSMNAFYNTTTSAIDNVGISWNQFDPNSSTVYIYTFVEGTLGTNPRDTLVGNSSLQATVNGRQLGFFSSSGYYDDSSIGKGIAIAPNVTLTAMTATPSASNDIYRSTANAGLDFTDLGDLLSLNADGHLYLNTFDDGEGETITQYDFQVTDSLTFLNHQAAGGFLDTLNAAQVGLVPEPTSLALAAIVIPGVLLKRFRRRIR